MKIDFSDIFVDLKIVATVCIAWFLLALKHGPDSIFADPFFLLMLCAVVLIFCMFLLLGQIFEDMRTSVVLLVIILIVGTLLVLQEAKPELVYWIHL